jgi:hypothetical protein
MLQDQILISIKGKHFWEKIPNIIVVGNWKVTANVAMEIAGSIVDAIAKSVKELYFIYLFCLNKLFN